MLNRMTTAGLPKDAGQKQQWADSMPLKNLFEQLWPPAQVAGLSRDDLGRQLEAECALF